MDSGMVSTKPQLSPFIFYQTPNHKLPSVISKSNPPTPRNHQPNLVQTKQIHAHFIKTGYDSSQNTSYLLASKTHLSPSAKYNFLITSYTKNNQPNEAVTIYAQMRKWGIEVDSFIIPSVVKACTEMSLTRIGEELHGYALRNGLGADGFVNNALMQMYGESRRVDSARVLFDEMCERDVVSWSTMVGNYSRNGLYDDALEFIREMFITERVKPSEAAVVSMFNMFADLANLRIGKSLHCYVMKNLNLDQMDVRLGTSLIDMYVNCGYIDTARSLFDALEDRSVVSWTVVIAGYIRCNKLDEAARMCSRMVEENVALNEISMLSFVIECGFARAVEFGKQLHAYILRNGFCFSVALATALVDMYGKCSDLKSAKNLFDNMDHRDVMTWTAMVTAYAQSRCINEAFDCFVDMRNAGINNEVTVASLLAMCGEAGASDMGKWIHAYIDKQGVEVDTILRTALVDMYSKCGDINAAKKVFTDVTTRDIGLWNAIICGLAMHGHGEEALQIYSELLKHGIRPNDITFIGILHACSHAGLVSEGRQIFKEMPDFHLAPKIEHYGCMVDILGRVGQLDEAYQMIQSMPMEPNYIIWGTLLAACRLHRNPKLGEIAAGKLRGLKPQNCGYNVLMSNIYAAANRWNDVSGIRKIIQDSGIRKEPGLSIIEVNGLVHQFMTGDRSHPLIAKIDNMLAEMNTKLKEAGYMADTSVVLRNISEEDKETSLTYHSEKLAMAFVISTSPGMPIRVMKNLRICQDCHAVTKLLSAIYGREFIVRDRNRFHLFKEGSCSCGDFW